MRKVLPIVLTLVLAVGNAGFAATAPTPTKAVVMASKTAVVQNFTENTVTVKEAGKNVTYAVNANTHVTSAGAEATFADVVKKGLVVTYSAKAGVLTHIEIPGVGIETQGTINTGVEISASGFMLKYNLTAVDVRVNTSDSNIIPADNATTKFKAVVTGEEEDDTFVDGADAKTIDIGDLDIVAGSLKVTSGTKTWKVAETGTFDAAVVGDEVKITKTKTFTSLVFEADLTKEERANLKVNFKKVMREITASESTVMPISTDAVIEFNGKTMPMVIEGSSAFVTTDLAGNVIYIDGFYKGQLVKFLGAKGNKAVIAIMQDGKTVMTDVIEVAADATVLSAEGAEIDFHNIKSGAMVKVTTDPDSGYKVVEMNVQK